LRERREIRLIINKQSSKTIPNTIPPIFRASILEADGRATNTKYATCCQHCSTMLEYDGGDVKVMNWFQRTPSIDDRYSNVVHCKRFIIRCVVCKQETIVPEKYERK